MPEPSPATASVDRLRATGLSAGLVRVEIADVAPFPDVEHTLRERKRTGLAADLTFTYNHPERSTDIRRSLPWAESLVVGAATYLPAAGTPEASPDHGRIARFMVDGGYEKLRAGLEAVARVLLEAGHRAEVVSDDNRLVDRAAAVRAGVGWWGKNAMVLVAGFGPWTLLGSVVTDASLPRSPPDRRGCGSCQACLPACPTGALVEPGVLDARRCLAALLQAPGPIPEWIRPLVGDRIYGCDDCLDACPPGGRLLASATRARGTVELAWLLRAGDAELMEHLDRLYLPRRRPAVLRRNALVAVGNVRPPNALDLIRPYLGHRDPVLASHARWAADRLSSNGETGQTVASGK